MKKLNLNCLLFVFASIFIVVGIWGDCFKMLINITVDALFEFKSGNTNIVNDYITDVQSITNKHLNYHDTLTDINSIRENIIGTRVVDKGETLVAKSDCGSLVGYFDDEYPKSEICKYADRIENNYNNSVENHSYYLYCKLPSKAFYNSYPQNIICYNKQNAINQIVELNLRNIPLIDFADELGRMGFNEEDVYFYTDHHWKPKVGFKATEIICKELNKRYGFIYDDEAISLPNYNIKTYKKQFLGSYGKKVGRYFTWHGPDDFDVITPKFNTDITEIHLSDNKTRSGSFENTLLFFEYLRKDYYNVNTYATYSGGDFRLQIIKNNLKPEGLKVLLIRNSYSCVISPFLALHVHELHVVDDREGDYPAGEPIDVDKYIKEEKFDYVIEIK